MIIITCDNDYVASTVTNLKFKTCGKIGGSWKKFVVVGLKIEATAD
jgi:hypothetical protein